VRNAGEKNTPGEAPDTFVPMASNELMILTSTVDEEEGIFRASKRVRLWSCIFLCPVGYAQFGGNLKLGIGLESVLYAQ
jgi:hypothetical protein